MIVMITVVAMSANLGQVGKKPPLPNDDFIPSGQKLKEFFQGHAARGARVETGRIPKNPRDLGSERFGRKGVGLFHAEDQVDQFMPMNADRRGWRAHNGIL
jgi:hypothetical protein